MYCGEWELVTQSYIKTGAKNYQIAVLRLQRVSVAFEVVQCVCLMMFVGVVSLRATPNQP